MNLFSLTAPYPMPQPRQRWRICLLVTVFVTLFLLTFQPFGLSTIPQHRTLVILGFGVVTLLGMVLVYVLAPRLLPGLFREERWTVGHSLAQLMASLLVIATGNLLLAAGLGFFPLTVGSYLQFIGITLAVGVFPGAASFFITHYLLLRKYLGQAQVLTEHIHRQQPAPSAWALFRVEMPAPLAPMPTGATAAAARQQPAGATTQPLPETTARKSRLELRDEDNRLMLQLAPQELLCLMAEDNYTEVFYLQKGELKKALIRNTLKNMEAAISHSPLFYRCHRSHIINLGAVEEVTGNAQGYRVKLQVMRGLVPVSRSRSREFSEKLEQQIAPKG